MIFIVTNAYECIHLFKEMDIFVTVLIFGILVQCTFWQQWLVSFNYFMGLFWNNMFYTIQGELLMIFIILIRSLDFNVFIDIRIYGRNWKFFNFNIIANAWIYLIISLRGTVTFSIIIKQKAHVLQQNVTLALWIFIKVHLYITIFYLTTLRKTTLSTQ